MRVVLSNGSYSWGGVHRVTETLARGLQARGHEVVAFCRPGSPLHERMREIVPCEPIVRGMDLHPGALRAISRALRRHRPAVLLTLMEKDVRLSSPVAWAHGIPVVVRRANDRPLPRNPYIRLLYGVIPTHHVANSEATRRTLLGSAPWLDPAAVTVIHNGIDPRPYEESPPADLALPRDALAIGFVGRFDERKGVLDLADAWPAVREALPRAHLVLVGTGALEAEMRARLGSDPRVRWCGYRSDVPSVMRTLHLLAMPSHWEGFGLSAAEAMAAGVPVVAARASSLPELIDDGVEGRLVPPASPESLAAALVELGRDPALRARMGAAGRERVRRDFSEERMLDGYERVLSAASEQRHPRRSR